MLCSCEFSPGAAALWVVGASCLVSVWCELLRALRSEADVIYFVSLLREADAHMGTIWIHRINCVFFGSSFVCLCAHTFSSTQRWYVEHICSYECGCFVSTFAESSCPTLASLRLQNEKLFVSAHVVRTVPAVC